MIMKTESPQGKYKDDKTYENVVNYVIQPGKCPSGHIITRNVNRNSIADDMANLEKKLKKRKGSTKIRHTVFSFEDQDEATPELAAVIADKICEFYADRYQIVAAVHEDTDHLHIHMVTSTTDIHSGKKHTGRKKDYYGFTRHVRKEARKHGMKFKTVK